MPALFTMSLSCIRKMILCIFPLAYKSATYIFYCTAFLKRRVFYRLPVFSTPTKKQGDIIEQNNRVWIIIGATFGALAGSRLVGGLEDVPAMLRASNKLFYFYQNKTVVGGFLGGLFGVEFCKKLIGEKDASGDLFTYPIILALIIGRVGCFSMGVYEETYGLPTALPWGMNLGDGVARHPVTLYEIGFLMLLLLLLVTAEKKFVLANGAKFKLFMIAYLFFRFVLTS